MEKSFVYGVAVGDYNFTGREAETRRLRQNFEGGINSILISPRRWGKTSLVNHVREQLKQWLTLFFWAPKSLQIVTENMKLKDAYSWEEKL